MPENVNQDPPLVDLKVTNPITFIKRWWARIIGNEGMSITIRVRPLTTIIVLSLVFSLLLSLGKFNSLSSLASPSPTPKEDSETWKETAYIGTLKYSENIGGYFLVTSSASEAISLDVPQNLDLSSLVERRILVIGKYSKSLRAIQVLDAKDMEILPKTPIPIPTLEPTPSSTALPTESPTSEPIMVE